MTDQNESVMEGVGEGVNTVKQYENFDVMGLPDNLLRAVYSYGFEHPSPIQKMGVVPIMEGNDLIAQAQSGTGKTGTFTIGSMARIDPKLNKVQVLIMVPVRELSQQIEEVARKLGTYLPVKVYSATGGTPIKDDIRAIESGVQFLVGTPGRIFDLMNRRVLQREHIRVIVLDEADQMLKDRFYEQTMHILRMGFPKTARMALFSATMSPEIVQIADKILCDPVRILIKDEEVNLAGIKQYHIALSKEEWKFDCLYDLYQQLNINQAYVYCNKRQKAEWIAEKLNSNGFPVSFIHGDMDVEERWSRMKRFRDGDVRVLVSTDMLARGIDVQQVGLVINFELPPEKANYIHRIGRSGRFGRKGIAINLIGPEEVNMMKDLESSYQIKIPELPQDLSFL